jgi:hypothetical protein
MRMRLGCVVTRAFAFKVALLLRFLRYMRTQPDTIENAILVVLVILSVFGFLRIGESVRLRLRHYRRYARAAVQYFILELEWCKQDQFAAGSEVVIAAESQSGIHLMAHVDTLIARLDTEWNMTDPSALLLPLDASGKAHTGTSVLAALRPHLLAMQAAGEPLLEKRGYHDGHYDEVVQTGRRLVSNRRQPRRSRDLGARLGHSQICRGFEVAIESGDVL